MSACITHWVVYPLQAVGALTALSLCWLLLQAAAGSVRERRSNTG